MVWAATWPTDPATLRTLTNSNGVTALAVFSDEKELEEAAIRYAWLGVDGRVPSKHLHISEVVRFAKQNRAQLVVVDIAADHSLELDEGEMELVSALPSTRAPSYQGMAPVTSSRPPSYQSIAPVHTSRPPMGSVAQSRPASQQKLDSVPSMRSPSQGGLKPSSVFPPDPNKPSTVAATFGSVAATTAAGPVSSPAAVPHVDALYDGLSHVLRDYPEVEWGCILDHARDDAKSGPCVALRIDASFRKNMNEISVKLREVAISHGQAHDILVLDAIDQIKHARQVGRPFYPWRKK